MATGIIYDGYPSMDEIKEANGWPDEERFAKGPVAVVECVQQIPCNPCESACPLHAIHIGEPITNTPQVDREKCIGCGMCVAACPGLAIFLVDKSYSETEATVSFPFEYDPLPEKGAEIDALSRAGEYVCKGRVVKVMNPKKNDHTPVVTIAIPKEHADTVRTMRRLKLPEAHEGFHPVEPEGPLDDDVIVCRCEEVTLGEILEAVRQNPPARTLDGVKLRTSAGMGRCQSGFCQPSVFGVLMREYGLRADQVTKNGGASFVIAGGEI